MVHPITTPVRPLWAKERIRLRYPLAKLSCRELLDDQSSHFSAVPIAIVLGETDQRAINNNRSPAGPSFAWMPRKWGS